jgi:hypothetical protein
MNVPLAHIAGFPIEEALGSVGPVVLVAVGLATSTLRARYRRARRRGVKV